MRRCIVCKNERPFECYKEGRKKCQLCRNSEKRPTRVGPSQRRKRLMASYGITLEEFSDMEKTQKGLCSICGVPGKNRWNGKLVVDHCHDTGRVRSLLCDLCNKGLGQFRDDPEIITAAATYLRGFKK